MPSFEPAFVGVADWAEDGSALQPATANILEAASEFLWSEEIAESLDAFSANHATMFVGGSVSGEQKLNWHQAYLDFQQLFEIQLEQFIARQSFSQADFEVACKVRHGLGLTSVHLCASSQLNQSLCCQDAKEHAAGGSAASIVNMVLASSTYEYFLQMMISAAEDENDANAASAADPDESGVLAIAHRAATGVLEPEPEPEECGEQEQPTEYTQEIPDFACEQAAIRSAMERRRNARHAAFAEAQVQVEAPSGAER